MNTLQLSNKPSVLIFAKSGGFSVSLVEQLVTNFCKVVIATEELEGWRRSLLNIPTSSIQLVHSSKVVVGSVQVNYIIYISDSVEYSSKDNSRNELYQIGEVFNISRNLVAPCLYIFPYTIYPDINLESIELARRLTKQEHDLVGTLFLGDLIGPRITFSDSRLLSKVVKEVVHDSHIHLPKTDVDLFPVSTFEAARHVVRRLFSFGSFGESTAIISTPLKSSNLPSYLRKLKPNLTVSFTDENFNFPKNEDLSRREHVGGDFEEVLKETIFWYFPNHNIGHFNAGQPEIPSIKLYKEPEEFFENPAPRQPSFKTYEQSIFNVEPPANIPSNVKKEVDLKKFVPAVSFSDVTKPLKKIRITLPKRHRKKTLFAFLLLVFLFVSPYLLWAVGGVSLYLAKNQLLDGNISRAHALTEVSQGSFGISYSELDWFSEIPVVGHVFDNSVTIARLSSDASNILVRAFNTINLTSEMTDRILGSDGKDINYYSRQESLELQSIYQELGFLEGEMSESQGVLRYFYDRVFGNISIKEIRNKIVYLQDFVEELPDLLGEKEKKTYLVLFQNNMELRPTGGFIGSFAFVSFDKGRLVDISVQDVYDADGQLKGHVEPPEPIKNYLGEANWYLRDSNWDPDFPTSADRAEWFLDKELDTKVDGVIAVDLEMAKELVNVFGSLKLSDFDKVITPNNLYEITQKEVEEDFFPGSRKKSNFLTSLTRELLTKVTKVEKRDYLKLSKAVLNNLERRHMQVFLHPVKAQRSISVLGWDGAIPSSTCSATCYGDYVELNDANVGVNKANYFVSKNMSLDVSIEKDGIYRTLTADYSNTSLNSEKDSNYKAYVRLIVPEKSENIQTQIVSAGSSNIVEPEISAVRDKKEVGVLINVGANQTLKLVYKWKSSLSVDAAYELLWRKQAGTNKDPIIVNIKNNTLTNQLPRSYNTTLDRDFFTRINF